MTRLILAIGLLALGIAGGLSFLASDAPDGLEHSLEQVGAPAAGPVVFEAPLADYQAPFFSNPIVRRVVAGLSGCLVVLGLVLAVGWILRRTRRVDPNGR